MGGGDLVDGATGRFGWGQSIGGVDMELELVDDRGDTGSCVVVVEVKARLLYRVLNRGRSKSPGHAKTEYGKRGKHAKIGSPIAVLRICTPLFWISIHINHRCFLVFFYSMSSIPILVLRQCVWRFSLVGTHLVDYKRPPSPIMNETIIHQYALSLVDQISSPSMLLTLLFFTILQ